MKKIWKKLAATILTIVMVVTMVPISAFASESKTDLGTDESVESQLPEMAKNVAEGEDEQAGFLDDLYFSIANNTQEANKIALDKIFASNEYEYTVVVPDNRGNNLYVKATLSEAGAGQSIKAVFANQNKNEQTTTALTNEKLTSLVYVAKQNSDVANTIDIVVGTGADAQTYKVKVLRSPALTALTAVSNKEGSIDKAFVANKPETLTMTTSGDYVDVSATAATPNTVITYNGNESNRVALNNGENNIVVTVTNTNNGLSRSYDMVVTKAATSNVKFDCNVDDARYFIYNSKNEPVYPNTDGSFDLIKGTSYTYNVTKNGYGGQTKTFEAGDSWTEKVTLEKAPDSTRKDIEKDTDWSSFRGNEENNGVVNIKTPTSYDNAALLWANKLGSGFGNAATGCPIIVGDYMYTYAKDNILKVDLETGEVVSSGKMAKTSAFAINSPTYGDGLIFVEIGSGFIQAFDAETLESVWLFQATHGGQPNCPIAYHDGYIYAGFWNGENKQASFACVSVTDEDPTKTDEVKLASWEYLGNGFYWAGAYANGDVVIVGEDDGLSGYSTGHSKISSLDPVTGKVKDQLILNEVGDLRTSICYDKDTDAYYFATKGGYFYQVKVDENGMFVENSLRALPLSKEPINPSAPPMCTSTPVIFNGRAYVGISGSSQFGSNAGHSIGVIDLEKFELVYQAYTKGYPQTSGLLSTGYMDEDGYVYVYFTENIAPGMVRYIKDKPGVTNVIDGVEVEVTDSKTKETKTIIEAPVLWTPDGAQQQYAICSIIADKYGTLYFKNDSAYMMAVGSAIKSIEVTKLPKKTTYIEGESFDPTGMKVVAHLANGLTKDITHLVEFNEEPLSLEDTMETITYTIVMYGDRLNENNERVAGTTITPLITGIDIRVISEETYNKELEARKEEQLNMVVTTNDDEKKLGISDEIAVPTCLLTNEALDTKEKIVSELTSKITQQSGTSNVKVMDLNLKVKDNNGDYQDATADDFGTDGKLVVMIPYPEGTNKDNYKFIVAHMFATEMFGQTPGDIEYPEVIKTEDGLMFTVTGLSPVAVSWSKIVKPVENKTDANVNTDVNSDAVPSAVNEEASNNPVANDFAPENKVSDATGNLTVANVNKAVSPKTEAATNTSSVIENETVVEASGVNPVIITVIVVAAAVAVIIGLAARHQVVTGKNKDEELF